MANKYIISHMQRVSTPAPGYIPNCWGGVQTTYYVGVWKCAAIKILQRRWDMVDVELGTHAVVCCYNKR